MHGRADFLASFGRNSISGGTSPFLPIITAIPQLQLASRIPRSLPHKALIPVFSSPIFLVLYTHAPQPPMSLTRFLTSITTTFSPFQPTSRTARLFLSYLPPSAHSSVAVKTTLLPRTSTQPATLSLTFKDGKVLDFDLEKAGIREVLEEVRRHGRGLGRKEELSGS